ncbi:MAG: DUF1043 family protein [Thiogranum sp.]|nr:DUF1043 family protein [Thiogranum sp.]
MESGIDMSWIWAIGLIAFAFGIAVGVGIAYVFFGSNRRTRELRAEMETLQQQFDDYRNQVGKHFLRTSELVQKMTDSYREVYEHLASGSQALCQNPVSTPRLDIPDAPGLDEQREGGTRRSAAEEYSDAEVDTLSDADSDNYLGDSPNVPKLDTGEIDPGVTHQRP